MKQTSPAALNEIQPDLNSDISAYTTDSTAEIAAHRVTASRATDVAGRRTHAYPIQACKCNATTASLRIAPFNIPYPGAYATPYYVTLQAQL